MSHSLLAKALAVTVQVAGYMQVNLLPVGYKTSLKRKIYSGQVNDQEVKTSVLSSFRTFRRERQTSTQPKINLCAFMRENVITVLSLCVYLNGPYGCPVIPISVRAKAMSIWCAYVYPNGPYKNVPNCARSYVRATETPYLRRFPLKRSLTNTLRCHHIVIGHRKGSYSLSPSTISFGAACVKSCCTPPPSSKAPIRLFL